MTEAERKQNAESHATPADITRLNLDTEKSSHKWRDECGTSAQSAAARRSSRSLRKIAGSEKVIALVALLDVVFGLRKGGIVPRTVTFNASIDGTGNSPVIASTSDAFDFDIVPVTDRIGVTLVSTTSAVFGCRCNHFQSA